MATTRLEQAKFGGDPITVTLTAVTEARDKFTVKAQRRGVQVEIHRNIRNETEARRLYAVLCAKAQRGEYNRK